MMDEQLNKPTEITTEDIDRFVEYLMNSEIKKHQCFKCSKEYLQSYGHHMQECDECWFSRFPEEQVKEFYRSFF
jgi:hypothetical protein